MAPSAKNPNVLSRAKLAARAQKKKTEIRRSQKRSQDKITRQDARRGARPGLLPTSGPNRALSRKKAKKVERALALALKRKAEAEGSMGIEGDTEGDDATKGMKTDEKDKKGETEEKMEVDDIA